jgi:ornithine cyclodeaminase/alanine dehydrogenase-like protein (mu-crystallin family)
MSLLVLTYSDVHELTSLLSPSELIHLSASTFSQFSNGTHDNPARTSITVPSYTTLIMPARSLDTTAVKLVSVPTSPNDTHGLPASTIVLDSNTGTAKAIVNARSLTALRTAAGCVSLPLFLMCSVSEQYYQVLFLHHTSLHQSALA